MFSFTPVVLLAVLVGQASAATEQTTIACRVNADCAGSTGAPTVSSITCANSATGTCNANGFCEYDTATIVARPAGSVCQGKCQAAGVCPGPQAVLINGFPCTTTPLSSSTTCTGNTLPLPAGRCVGEVFCNGTAAIPYCPVPLVAGVETYPFASNTTICREATDLCDAPEFCTGASFSCPPVDAVSSNTTVCRAATAGTGTAAGCDIAATCTGTSKVCPANAFKSNTTVCRNATGTCDPAETCTGVNASCPADAFASATTVCGNASGICFNNSLCSGNSSACLLKPVANGTACGNSTNPATCNGAGTCSLTCLAKQTACSKTTPPCCARCDGTKYVCRKNSAGDKLCLACVKTGNKCKKTKDCCTGTCKNGKCA